VRGMNNQIFATRYDDAQWSGWSGVPGAGETNSGPVVASTGNRLTLIMRRADNGIGVHQLGVISRAPTDQ
jgi:hypothetical protein